MFGTVVASIPDAEKANLQALDKRLRGKTPPCLLKDLVAAAAKGVAATAVVIKRDPALSTLKSSILKRRGGDIPGGRAKRAPRYVFSPDIFSNHQLRHEY